MFTAGSVNDFALLTTVSMFDGARWILFDAVGTLMFPEPSVAEVYYAAAARFGSRLSLAEIHRRFPLALEKGFSGGCETSEENEHNRWRAIVAEVVNDIPQPENVEAVFRQLWLHFAQPGSWRLYDDAAAALRELHGRGFRLGIASNFDGRLNRIVGGHAALGACEKVFVSSDVGYCKPDARFFRTIQDRLGVAANQIALVGDDEMCDVQAATVAGWRAIHLDRSATRAHAIQSLYELL